jgi:hypothetical protein
MKLYPKYRFIQSWLLTGVRVGSRIQDCKPPISRHDQLRRSGQGKRRGVGGAESKGKEGRTPKKEICIKIYCTLF